MKPRKEYLALPSGVRGLEEKNQTERDRERERNSLNNNGTPILAAVLSLGMLCAMANHDDHTKSEASLSAFEKLSVETGKWLIKKKRAAQYRNTK